jgi:sialidase-1
MICRGFGLLSPLQPFLFSMILRRFLSALFVGAATMMSAQTILFHTGDSTGFPYRIPSIATAKNGDLIALSDLRPCGGDIGYGRVDILGRTSRDNGASWTAPYTVLAGSGHGKDTGYGDACLVADRDRNELLLVCVSGDTPYWSSTVAHSQRLVSLHAAYDKRRKEWVWETTPTDHTDTVYHTLFGDRINGLFMGSGRICQSRRIKVGRYYRLYGALCTHRGNFVLYSDDFGRSWSVLGSAEESCAPHGDEPKCEELPDGSVVLSSRKAGGRYFNIFRYTDTKHYSAGAWGTAIDSRTAPGGIANESGACNGEILLVPVRRTADGKKTHLILQSLPGGPGRTLVSLYWKELATAADYASPEAFASHWQGAYRVSDRGSAYSTMALQADGRLAFYYEEEPGNYQMTYRALSIDSITGHRYRVE